MSKVFYDHLVDFSELESLIKRNITDPSEREEIYRIIDEIVHHRVLGCILDRLPREHHSGFLNEVSERPHDEGILEYLKDKVVEDVAEFIKREIHGLSVELLGLVAEKTDSKPKLTSKN